MQWLSFALWLAYGLLVWRKRGTVLAWARSRPMRSRLPLSIGLLFGGAAVLLGGLTVVDHFGGFALVWAWPAVILLGIVFVHCQVLAAVLAGSAVLFADTSTPPKPSNSEEVDHP